MRPGAFSPVHPFAHPLWVGARGRPNADSFSNLAPFPIFSHRTRGPFSHQTSLFNLTFIILPHRRRRRHPESAKYDSIDSDPSPTAPSTALTVMDSMLAQWYSIFEKVPLFNLFIKHFVNWTCSVGCATRRQRCPSDQHAFVRMSVLFVGGCASVWECGVLCRSYGDVLGEPFLVLRTWLLIDCYTITNQLITNMDQHIRHFKHLENLPYGRSYCTLDRWFSIFLIGFQKCVTIN